MNPAYKIPSHEIFGTTILDEVYLDTKQVLKSEVERRKVTIMQVLVGVPTKTIQ